MMRILRYVVITSFIHIAPVLGAKIYREPSSIFSSGEEDRKILENNTTQVITKEWHQIQWDKSKAWIESQNLWLPHHLYYRAKLVVNTSLYRSPFLESPTVTQLKQDSDVRVLRVNENWALVQSLETQYQGWLNREYLESLTNDWGYGITKQKSPLRTSPHLESAVLKYIPQNTLVLSVKISEQWMKVYADNFSGYILLNHLLTKADFIDQISYANSWLKVNNIIAHWFQIGNQQFIDFSAIQGIKMSLNWGYVAKDQVPTYSRPTRESDIVSYLSYLHPVKPIGQQIVKWGESKTEKRGEKIWWPINIEDSLLMRKSDSIFYDTATLFRRRVYDIATSPIIPNLMFASASGVFKTKDGDKWVQLKEFQNQDHPIAISKEGTIYIGHLRSDDHGETFQHYIRWEKIISLIQKKYHHSPKNIKLQRIQLGGNSNQEIEITLETDLPIHLTLMSHNQGGQWVLKEL